MLIPAIGAGSVAVAAPSTTPAVRKLLPTTRLINYVHPGQELNSGLRNGLVHLGGPWCCASMDQYAGERTNRSGTSSVKPNNVLGGRLARIGAVTCHYVTKYGQISSITDQSDVTMLSWYYPTANDTDDPRTAWIYYGSSRGMYLRVRGALNRQEWYVWGATSSMSSNISGNPTYNEWHAQAGNFSPTAMFSHWIDGKQERLSTGFGEIGELILDSVRSCYTTVTGVGLMAIWNRCLSQEEMRRITTDKDCLLEEF